VYFVRHGETLANKMRIHQSSDEALTVKGRLQAHHVAHILEMRPIDTVIASPFRRARETAAIISDHLRVPYMLEESVVEIRRPDHLYGQPYYSRDTLVYFYRLFREREHPRWEYAGAENMYMLRNRIEDIKKKIMSHEGEHITVVSHDIFMNLFLEHVCRQKHLTFTEFIRIIMFVRKTPNTVILYLTYNPQAARGTCAWNFVERILPQHSD
jgi:broad specificity phosphatase PhoE